ncbi:MAG TPA: MAPEG family protein [Hyphomicrobiaceae bacterium]|nr:MAPEG family protein [Hyphomicrobiaceae bacterium]
MRMTPELFYLLWSVALTMVLVLVATLGATQQVGLPTLAGNRENLPEMTGWAGRAERAHRNMLESLVLFAILVLAARALNISNGMTVLGAQLFFWGRVAHAALYIAGIPWLRTAAWLLSVVGLVLIFLQLIA